MFYTAVATGNTTVFEDLLNEQLQSSISFMDSAENFYHGFLLGILGAMPNYQIRSNRESGKGRYDIALEPVSFRKPVIILELKRVTRFSEMETKCQEALHQIDIMQYDAEYVEKGYPNIMKYGICFCGKDCMIQLKD